MGNVIPITDIETGRKDYCYAVYEHKLVRPDEMIYSRSFIVIKNRYDVIIHAKTEAEPHSRPLMPVAQKTSA